MAGGADPVRTAPMRDSNQVRGSWRRTSGLYWGTSAIITALLGGGLSSCAQLGKAADACGLSCPAKGLLEGNASISGIQSIDAFFGALVDFKGAADLMTDNIAEAKARMALSVGLPAAAGDAELKAALKAKIDANASGGLKVKFAPPECKASIDVTVEATARCDADFDPGSASVKCEGSCTAEASAEMKCDAEAEMVCHGTAPSLKCEGSCTGSCELNAAAKCDGTCKGTCAGSGGTQQGFNGKCDGTCKGECELEVGGECSGSCKGECAYTAPSGGCQGGAKVECKAKGDAKLECKGECSGQVEPPKAKAECEAAASAKANASAECTPPAVDVAFKYKANLTASQKAEFDAWLSGFKANLGTLSAEAQGRGKLLIASAGTLAAAAEGAVKGSISEMANAKADIKVAAGAGCALQQLGGAKELLVGVKGQVEGNVSSVADVMSVVGG